MTASIFNLKVQQFDQLCAFELSWGKSQQLGVTLAYPDNLNLNTKNGSEFIYVFITRNCEVK